MTSGGLATGLGAADSIRLPRCCASSEKVGLIACRSAPLHYQSTLAWRWPVPVGWPRAGPWLAVLVQSLWLRRLGYLVAFLGW